MFGGRGGGANVVIIVSRMTHCFHVLWPLHFNLALDAPFQTDTARNNMRSNVSCIIMNNIKELSTQK